VPVIPAALQPGLGMLDANCIQTLLDRYESDVGIAGRPLMAV
jgi:hypothetical protein